MKKKSVKTHKNNARTRANVNDMSGQRTNFASKNNISGLS